MYLPGICWTFLFFDTHRDFPGHRHHGLTFGFIQVRDATIGEYAEQEEAGPVEPWAMQEPMVFWQEFWESRVTTRWAPYQL